MTRNLHPGDWLDVGKQTALRWIADGAAEPARPLLLDADLRGCGAKVFGNLSLMPRLTDSLKTLTVHPASDTILSYAKTLFWTTDFPLRPELVPLGFHLLDEWEVAIPIASYDQLAIHVGTPDARQRTEAVIRDLRVMCYHPSLMFVKRCRAGKDFIQAWENERASGDDARLCLLRALYQVKPLICALPVTWSKAVHSAHAA